jgi:DNA-binding MarR family transcriptional regulator
MIIEHGSDDFARLQKLSRTLFGNQDRLVVAVAVASHASPLLFARELAAALRITDHRVAIQLKAFENAGLMIRLPRTKAERTQYVQRLDSCFWRMVVELSAEALAHQPASA